MCRWLAYSGSPILLSEALFSPMHSMIDQSLHSKLGAEATNGDGFGVGWYDDAPTPGLFRSVEPAWNDQNLRELASHITSRHFFTHLRAAIGSAVQQTNCHPFRYENWLWMHNGFIADFAKIKRELVLTIDPSLYPLIVGTADTEVLFYLALTLGLQDDPPAAVARAIGMVEDLGRRQGIQYPFQGTIATTDGDRTWAFRYSSQGESRSLFYTLDVPTLRKLYPELQVLQELSAQARMVVSEPIGDAPDAWREVPESTCVAIGPGHEELLPFRPTPQTTSITV